MTDKRLLVSLPGPIAVALLLLLGVQGTGCWGRYCEHDTYRVTCGLNGRGVQTQTCTNGVYRNTGPCEDPDVCADGASESVEPTACGLNGRGVSTQRTCTSGKWVISSCNDPDACVDGNVEPEFCGPLNRRFRQCAAGQWGAYGACEDPLPSLTIEVPGRQDMVYDDARHRLYISTSGTSGEVKVFNLLTRQFEYQLYTTGDFRGIDLSPDGTKLLVARANSWLELLRVVPSPERLWIAQPPGIKEFSVAFTSNTEALVTSDSDGSAEPVFLYRVNLTDQTVQAIATVRPKTMLAPSADRSTVAYAQGTSLSGDWGHYQTIGQTFTNFTMGKLIYEIATSRSGTQYALPTSDGLYIFDGAAQQQALLGQAGSQVPIAAVYSPVADELYLAWSGGSTSIDAYSATTFQKLRDIEPTPGLFSWVDNRAFVEGRMRLSRDGSLLFVSMGNNVVVYPTGR